MREIYTMFLNWKRKKSSSSVYSADISESSSENRLMLEFLDREADRQLSSHAQTAGGLTTRAALLVSTAIFFVSLQGGDGSASWFYIVALIAALAGAVCGVWALFMNRKGEEIDLKESEEDLWGMPDLDSLRALTESKREILDDDREWLKN